MGYKMFIENDSHNKKDYKIVCERVYVLNIITNWMYPIRESHKGMKNNIYINKRNFKIL